MGRGDGSLTLNLSPRFTAGAQRCALSLDPNRLHLSTRQMLWYDGRMKITVVSGERSVVVKVKGSSPARMKEAEALATRLLTVGQTEAPAKPPIGFTAATVAETEVVGDAPTNGNEVE